MGPLQEALAAVGVVIIAAVLGFNGWQSWQLRRRRARIERGERDERGEPGAGDLFPATTPQDRVEPGLDEVGEAARPAGLPETGAEATRARTAAARIDPLIDAIACFVFEQPVPGEALQQRLPRTARAGTKPLLFEGRNARTGAWETLHPGERYAELQAAVQMASRSGALNAIEYSEFVTKCHALGEALGVAPDLPDMAEVLEQARELDGFAAGNDAQLSINLQAQGVAWGLDFLRQQAQACGFTTNLAAGRMALVENFADESDPQAEPRRYAVVQLQYDAHAELSDDPAMPVARATLLLDVPHVAPGLRPFARMREAARQLSQALGARQVDDNGAALSPAALDQIEQQLQQLYASLEARGLGAGTPAAQRLFA
jgi:hypothetical protein